MAKQVKESNKLVCITETPELNKWVMKPKSKTIHYPEFGAALGRLVKDSGLTFKAVEHAVYDLYGQNITITSSDLSMYLMGERLPRADKLAALLDALNVTHSEMAMVLRSFPRKKDVLRNQ